MVEIVGYAIVDIKTGDRWGNLYESKVGAMKSFDFHKGIQDRSFTRKLKWKEQTKFKIAPLTYFIEENN